MPTKTLYQPPGNGPGIAFKYWAVREENLDDLENWLSQKFQRNQQEALARLLRLLSRGTPPKLHPSEEKFKHEFDKIFAIKSGQIRLYGFQASETEFVIVDFIKKQRQKLSGQQRQRIEERYEQCAQER
jgi:hypothetical protein